MISRSFLASAALAFWGIFALPNSSAAFVLLTTNTLITPFDSSYDGLDLAASNCVLTIDGEHHFSNLRLANGAMLSHSAFPGGAMTSSIPVLNELHILTGSTPISLNHERIAMESIVVKDVSGTTTYTNSQDYELNLLNETVLLQRTGSSAIPDGGNVSISYNYDVITSSGLRLTISHDLQVDFGSIIDVTGLGYDGSFSLGRGRSSGSPPNGGGGGHGGYGGMGESNALGGNVFDSQFRPIDKGGAGGNGSGGTGGNGGGAVQIQVDGTLDLQGSIVANGANGTNSRSGGGAGGSIWLTAQNVIGTGLISADGGNGEPVHGGGGGGGRIALYFTTNNFAGPISNRGGLGFVPGGAGTTYVTNQFGNSWTSGGANARLLLDNGGRSGTNTLLASIGSADLKIANGAIGLLPSAFACSNAVIGPNGFLTSLLSGSVGLQAFGNVEIEFGSGIVADGTAANNPQGSGGVSGSAGAGHGGFGGAATNGALAGNTYGVIDRPGTLGSMGAPDVTSGLIRGGRGGGGFYVGVGGDLTVNGRISVNGTEGIGGPAGGGSGGSIWISARNLMGEGIISANGADGVNGGGGGGGGRIALYLDTNSFTGTVSAFGGVGTWNGGAGTIYSRMTGEFPGSVVLDNNELAGKTSLFSQTPMDFIIRRGAIGIVSGSGNKIANLLVKSNGFISKLNNLIPDSGIGLSISQDATIEPGGGIIGDGLGYPANAGPGAGTSYGVGGGYGGYGGRGSNGGSGGNSVGLFTQVESGSGGNPYQNTYAAGGAGGSSITFTVGGKLTLDGIISANGDPGSSSMTSIPAGGGSGGGIQLSISRFSGSGGIFANGGNGTNGGGGGGGGRVVLIMSQPFSNSFAGTISAHGGTGFQSGGAGTICFQTNVPFSNLIIIDNDGIQGTNTPISIGGTYDFLIRNGGVATFTGSQPIRNLTVSSNGVVMPPPGNSLNLAVSGNASIESGGGLIADGAGIGAGLGAGKGLGTGGGHGGSGAGGAGGISGGIAYGSPAQPTTSGSMGNAVSGLSKGGAGGSIIQLDVGGTLNVNGRISADGTAGVPFTGQQSEATAAIGGGSGGTIVLSANKLTGSGVISVNGGPGLNGGGGGGGGRIAVSYTSNSFAGTLSAYGGTGFYNGGAGTIYLKRYPSQIGTLLIDNGGLEGTTTPLMFSNDDVQVAGNAIVVWNTQISLGSLLVRSNGWLISRNSPLVISRNAVVEAGGVITADGQSDSGQANGSSTSTPKGGASHGGYGGANSGNVGGVYDSIVDPFQNGSRGGSGSGSPFLSPRGGAGGGIIKMQINGSLSVTGRISSDGFNGELNSGGGSGGTISMLVGQLSGPGLISANGGDGDAAGGGGGGRIAITYGTNNFSGTFAAHGGTGFVGGGAGTIYLKNKTVRGGDLIVDNGGLAGTNTPLGAIYKWPSTPFNLTISNRASVYVPESYISVSNLNIGALGSLILLPGQSNLTIAATNATIQQAGSIYASDAGFSQAQGFGAGGVILNSGKYEGAGGGHGGRGGNSAAGAIGGTNYGSMTHPVSRGSGGGFGNGPAFGILDSTGGGAIRFNVTGNLTVNGAVIADGKPGLQDDAGGGAGGSIWISATTLTGTGRISANGGDGELFRGGGGGGGRIAVYSPANTFSGLVGAYGGDGAFPGEAGTVYLSADFANGFQILSQNPTGRVSVAVSSIDLEFNELINAATLSASDFVLTTPSGVLPTGDLQVSMPELTTVRLSFPPQTLSGEYQLAAGPNIQNAFGESLSQIFNGSFSISTTTISVALQGSDLLLQWFGNSGVQYQIYSSTNLVDWLPFGEPIIGNDAAVELPLPVESAPAMYFRAEVK